MGRKRHRPSRKRVLRGDDPALKWDYARASKRDRIRDSPDSYLRPTNDRVAYCPKCDRTQPIAQWEGFPVCMACFTNVLPSEDE